jgi:hypothetical protein
LLHFEKPPYIQGKVPFHAGCFTVDLSSAGKEEIIPDKTIFDSIKSSLSWFMSFSGEAANQAYYIYS